jgi:hypothetical protein
MSPEINHYLALAIDANSQGRDDLRLAAEVGILRMLCGMLFQKIPPTQRGDISAAVVRQLRICISAADDDRRIEHELNTK